MTVSNRFNNGRPCAFPKCVGPMSNAWEWGRGRGAPVHREGLRSRSDDHTHEFIRVSRHVPVQEKVGRRRGAASLAMPDPQGRHKLDDLVGSSSVSVGQRDLEAGSALTHEANRSVTAAGNDELGMAQSASAKVKTFARQ